MSSMSRGQGCKKNEDLDAVRGEAYASRLSRLSNQATNRAGPREASLDSEQARLSRLQTQIVDKEGRYCTGGAANAGEREEFDRLKVSDLNDGAKNSLQIPSGPKLDQMFESLNQRPDQEALGADDQRHAPTEQQSKNLLTSLKSRPNGTAANSVMLSKGPRLASPTNMAVVQVGKALQGRAPFQQQSQAFQTALPRQVGLHSPPSRTVSVVTNLSHQAAGLNRPDRAHHLNHASLQGGATSPPTHATHNSDFYQIPNAKAASIGGSDTFELQDLAIVDSADMQIIYEPQKSITAAASTVSAPGCRQSPQGAKREVKDQIIDAKRCKSKLQMRSNQLRERCAELERKFLSYAASLDGQEQSPPDDQNQNGQELLDRLQQITSAVLRTPNDFDLQDSELSPTGAGQGLHLQQRYRGGDRKEARKFLAKQSTKTKKKIGKQRLKSPQASEPLQIISVTRNARKKNAAALKKLQADQKEHTRQNPGSEAPSQQQRGFLQPDRRESGDNRAGTLKAEMNAGELRDQVKQGSAQKTEQQLPKVGENKENQQLDRQKSQGRTHQAATNLSQHEAAKAVKSLHERHVVIQTGPSASKTIANYSSDPRTPATACVTSSKADAAAAPRANQASDVIPSGNQTGSLASDPKSDEQHMNFLASHEGTLHQGQGTVTTIKAGASDGGSAGLKLQSLSCDAPARVGPAASLASGPAAKRNDDLRADLKVADEQALLAQELAQTQPPSLQTSLPLEALLSGGALEGQAAEGKLRPRTQAAGHMEQREAASEAHPEAGSQEDPDFKLRALDSPTANDRTNYRSHRAAEHVKITDIIQDCFQDTKVAAENAEERLAVSQPNRRRVGSYQAQSPQQQRQSRSVLRAGAAKQHHRYDGRTSVATGDADDGDDEVVVTGIETGEFRSGASSSKYFGQNGKQPEAAMMHGTEEVAARLTESKDKAEDNILVMAAIANSNQTAAANKGSAKHKKENGGKEDEKPRNATASAKDDSKPKKWPTAAQEDGRQGAPSPNRAGFKPFQLSPGTDQEQSRMESTAIAETMGQLSEVRVDWVSPALPDVRQVLSSTNKIANVFLEKPRDRYSRILPVPTRVVHNLGGGAIFSPKTVVTQSYTATNARPAPGTVFSPMSAAKGAKKKAANANVCQLPRANKLRTSVPDGSQGQDKKRARTRAIGRRAMQQFASFDSPITFKKGRDLGERQHMLQQQRNCFQSTIYPPNENLVVNEQGSPSTAGYLRNSSLSPGTLRPSRQQKSGFYDQMSGQATVETVVAGLLQTRHSSAKPEQGVQFNSRMDCSGPLRPRIGADELRFLQSHDNNQWRKKSSRQTIQKQKASLSDRRDLGSEGSTGSKHRPKTGPTHLGLSAKPCSVTSPAGLTGTARVEAREVKLSGGVSQQITVHQKMLHTDSGGPDLLPDGAGVQAAGASATGGHTPSQQSHPLSNLLISRATNPETSSQFAQAQFVQWQEAPTINVGQDLQVGSQAHDSTQKSKSKDPRSGPSQRSQPQNGKRPRGQRQLRRSWKGAFEARASSSAFFVNNKSYKMHPDRQRAIESFVRRFQHKQGPNYQRHAQQRSLRRFRFLGMDDIGLMQEDSAASEVRNGQMRASMNTYGDKAARLDAETFERLKEQTRSAGAPEQPAVAGGRGLEPTKTNSTVINGFKSRQAINAPDSRSHNAGVESGTGWEPSLNQTSHNQVSHAYLNPIHSRQSPRTTMKNQATDFTKQDNALNLSSTISVEAALPRPGQAQAPIGEASYEPPQSFQVSYKYAIEVNEQQRIQVTQVAPRTEVKQQERHQSINQEEEDEDTPVRAQNGLCLDPGTQTTSFEDVVELATAGRSRYDSIPAPERGTRMRIHARSQSSGSKKVAQSSAEGHKLGAPEGKLAAKGGNRQADSRHQLRKDSQRDADFLLGQNIIHEVSIFNDNNNDNEGDEGRNGEQAQGSPAGYRGSAPGGALATTKTRRAVNSKSTANVGSPRPSSYLNEDLDAVSQERNLRAYPSGGATLGLGGGTKVAIMSKNSLTNQSYSRQNNNASSKKPANAVSVGRINEPNAEGPAPSYALATPVAVSLTSINAQINAMAALPQQNYNVLIVNQDQFELMQQQRGDKSKVSAPPEKATVEKSKPEKPVNTVVGKKMKLSQRSSNNIASYYAEGKNKLPRPRPLKSDASFDLSSNEGDTNRSGAQSKKTGRRSSLPRFTDHEQVTSAHMLSQSRQSQQPGSGSTSRANDLPRAGALIYSEVEFKTDGKPEPPLSLDTALSHAALPCPSSTLMNNREHIKYQTRVMVDQGTGMGAIGPGGPATAELIVVSDDFYATQFLSSFHKQNINALRQRPYLELLSSSLGKKTMKIKTFKCPLPDPSENVRSATHTQQKASTGNNPPDSTGAQKNDKNDKKHDTLQRRPAQTSLSPEHPAAKATNIIYQKGCQRPQTSENRFQFPRSRLRKRIPPIGARQSAAKKMADVKSRHAGAARNDRSGSFGRPRLQSDLIKQIEYHHQLIPSQYLDLPKFGVTSLQVDGPGDGSLEEGLSATQKQFSLSSTLKFQQRGGRSGRHGSGNTRGHRQEDIDRILCGTEIEKREHRVQDSGRDFSHDEEADPLEEHGWQYGSSWIEQHGCAYMENKPYVISPYGRPRLTDKAHPYLRKLKMQGLKLATRLPAQGQSDNQLGPGGTFGVQGPFGGTPPLSPHYNPGDIPDHQLARELQHQRLFLNDLELQREENVDVEPQLAQIRTFGQERQEQENRTVMTKLSAFSYQEASARKDGRQATDSPTGDMVSSGFGGARDCPATAGLGADEDRSPTLGSQRAPVRCTPPKALTPDGRQALESALIEPGRNAAQNPFAPRTAQGLLAPASRPGPEAAEDCLREAIASVVGRRAQSRQAHIWTTQVDGDDVDLAGGTQAGAYHRQGYRKRRTLDDGHRPTHPPPRIRVSPHASVLQTAKFNSIKASSPQRNRSLKLQPRGASKQAHGMIGMDIVVNGHLELTLPDGRPPPVNQDLPARNTESQLRIGLPNAEGATKKQAAPKRSPTSDAAKET